MDKKIMSKFRCCVSLIFGLMVPVLHAKLPNGSYTRDFWSPTYHIQRLSYCTYDGKRCGKTVAAEFCHLMGFESLTHEEIDHNVGLTNYIDNNFGCRGWKCDGFKLIQCTNKITHDRGEPYHYAMRQFVFPRFDHHRVDWCMEKKQNCGKPAAYSFCRRLGYEHVQSFEIDNHVYATRTLGSQSLCFGNKCLGFSKIICRR